MHPHHTAVWPIVFMVGVAVYVFLSYYATRGARPERKRDAR